MSSRLTALNIAAAYPAGLARFWAGLLGWQDCEEGSGFVGLTPPEVEDFGLRFSPATVPKTGQNLMHFDLTSTSLTDQQATVDRALSLGARHIDIGQLPEEGHVVLADPEGNEFCVIEPGNNFLAECGFVGALACDGSQEVGYFWSQALGWPLVWDQDEETAIRSPHGGPKVTWGGPPLMPRNGPGRQHFDLTPADGDQSAEVARLLSIGATALTNGESTAGRTVLADPDGNTFCVLAAPPQPDK
ncbi:VOC family protein [Nakamurella silvestris]|nr:VOC family protein [Nakamurella silvestris]